jgi:MFS family permease
MRIKRRTFLSAILVTLVQYYDYTIYGFLASTISENFFSQSSPSSQLIKTYSILAASVLAKPLGAIILGRLGDLYGRSFTLTVSLIGTAVPSLIIAITPGYSEIGLFSALILLLCRMSIAASVSSGTDGVRIYVYEHIGRQKQCLGNGLVTMASQIGSFSASMASLFFTLKWMPDYAWRGAFLLGSIMGFTMIFMRKMLSEDDLYSKKDSKEEEQTDLLKSQPTFKIIFRNLGLFILSVILAGCIGGTYQFNIIFLNSYMFKVTGMVEETTMKGHITTAILLYMAFAVIAGAAADHFGKLFTATISSVFILILSIINFWFISGGRFIVILYFMITSLIPFLTMPALLLLKQSIPATVRYRIFSLAHAFGSIVISNTTPLVSTAIYRLTYYKALPFIYFIFLVFTMLAILHILNKNYKYARY